MLGSVIWINGRNNRTKWWAIQLIYAGFIAFIWLSVVRSGAFVFPANDPSGINTIRMIQDNVFLQVADGVYKILVIPIWWMTWVNNVRRYHDINKSGWWALNTFIPLVGYIWQIAQLGFTPGTPGGNDYGPSAGSNPALGDESDDGSPASGVLAKVDNKYLEEYARKYAAEQALKAAPSVAAVAQASFGRAPTGGGAFGKRR